MKLILEGWRQFRKKSLNEISGAGGASEEASLGALVSIADSKKAKSIFKKIYNTLNYYNTKANQAAQYIYLAGAGIIDGIGNSTTQEKAEFVAMMVDPTGVTGYGDLKNQWKAAEDEIFQKGDLSYGTALMLVLATMGALPVVNTLVKGGKVSMKTWNVALVKVGKAGPAGAKAAQKAKGAVGDAIKTSSKTATTGKTQKTARAASAVYKPIDGVLTSAHPYVIVQRADGSMMAFYKSSGLTHSKGEPWIPLGGQVLSSPSVKLDSPGILKINKYGIMDSPDTELVKYQGLDSATWMNPRTGKSSTGKFVKPESEMGQISAGLDATPFKGVDNMYKSPIEALFKEKGLHNDTEFLDKLNKSLESIGKPGVTKNYLEDIATNAHLRSKGALAKQSKGGTWSPRQSFLRFPGIDGEPTIADVLDAFERIAKL